MYLFMLVVFEMQKDRKRDTDRVCGERHLKLKVIEVINIHSFS